LLLWPDSDSERARNSLNVSVYVLRRTLGEEVVLSDGDELRLNTDVVAVDVVEFETALAKHDHEQAVSLCR
jgi:DNA-binding SARP family transcriptional activator